jgi:RNA polymerase sigma factor (sigma-70 family)
MALATSKQMQATQPRAMSEPRGTGKAGANGGILVGMTKQTAATETRYTLIQRVAALDAASWNEFVTLYEPLLLAYVGDCNRRNNLGLQEHDREDVKQEVLIKLCRFLPTFTPEPSEQLARRRFRTWLWQVVYNATIDWARRRWGRRPPGGGDAPPPKRSPEVAMTAELLEQADGNVPPPDEQLIQEHLWQVRRHILDRVRNEMQSAQKWECFAKHFLDGAASAAVAAELGLSVSAVNTYTSRVLARIRELSAEYEVEL